LYGAESGRIAATEFVVISVTASSAATYYAGVVRTAVGAAPIVTAFIVRRTALIATAGIIIRTAVKFIPEATARAAFTGTTQYAN